MTRPDSRAVERFHVMPYHHQATAMQRHSRGEWVRYSDHEPIAAENAALRERVEAALGVIEQYGGIDGEHHKQWVADQVARVLVGERYDAWVAEMCVGEDGPDTYEWDSGIAP